MRNITLLIRKDILTTRVLLGAGLLLYIAAWIGFSIFISSMAVFYGIVMVYVIIFTLFGADENQQISEIGNILPVSRGSMVTARYFFSWLVSLAVSGVTALLILLPSPYAGGAPGGAAIFTQLAASALLIVNLTFPIIYRVGMQKARLYCTIIYMVAIISSSWMQSYLPDAVSFLPVDGSLIMPAFLALMLLLSPVSMHLSRRWYRSR